MDTGRTINHFSLSVGDEMILAAKGLRPYATTPCPGTGDLHDPYIYGRVHYGHPLEATAFVRCRNCDFRSRGSILEPDMIPGIFDINRSNSVPGDRHDISQVFSGGIYFRDDFNLRRDDPDLPEHFIWWQVANPENDTVHNFHVDRPIAYYSHDRPPILKAYYPSEPDNTWVWWPFV